MVCLRRKNARLSIYTLIAINFTCCYFAYFLGEYYCFNIKYAS